ncbi:endonuclease/exonuclease/phosphatase family protein [Thioclava sp. BHET1]|nr:endonuclease/exonuclease/phosphatase family protein [Thioclava sp. BHET1]
MGLHSGQPVHARHRDGACGHDDRAQAPRAGKFGLLAGLILAAGLLCPGVLAAQTLRIATWNVELSRKGPGLLLRDTLRGGDPQIAAVTRILDAAQPDVILLTGLDWDLDGRALDALNATLFQPYPHSFAPAPNTGLQTGVDLDGDGVPHGPRDAQGYGRFRGQGGMALLSRLPIEATKARDFSTLLWRDLPQSAIGRVQLSDAAQAVQRLSSTGHWDVPLVLPDGARLHLFAFAATPPVFDGPEDRNGWRNHDEAAFWLQYLDGALADDPPDRLFVLLGDFNLDPSDGEGNRAALHRLLHDPRLQDPAPRSAGAQGAADPAHQGEAALDTVDYEGPGNLRVDYVLPSAALSVTGAGVIWPSPEAPLAEAAARASRHRLVWVDIALAP